MMNRIRQVRGACLRYVMNRNRQVSRRVWGGGGWGLRHPPIPPPLFEAVQGCLKASGLKFWLKPIMRALCLQMGGAAPPPPAPPRCLSRASQLQSMLVFLDPIMRAFCLQRAGGLRPPFKQCKLASKYMSFLF